MRSVEEIKGDAVIGRLKGREALAEKLKIELLLDIREQLKDIPNLIFELQRVHKEIETIRLRG